jgi:hypothetical protein
MGPRQQGRIPRRLVTPASGDYRYRQELALAVVTQPSTTRTAAAQSSPCQRVVAEVLADFTDRSSEFTSAVCVAVCDRAGAAAFHGQHWVVPG